MNFEVSNCQIVPFSLSENDVRDQFIDFVIDGENSPLDVAYKATIKDIKKEYYPVRCFDIEYSANWSATSIWEHKEEYTEYEPKTVYIDYYGKEHDKPGFDHFSNGSYIGTSNFGGQGKRPWKAQQTIKPVIKHKIVVDNVETTYGGIEKEKTFQPIITYENKSKQDFANWIVNFSRGGHILSESVLLEKCDIKSLVETDEFAKSIAIENAKQIALKQCRAQIPGNRYEDFGMDDFETASQMIIYLYPVYYVCYTYNGIDYECWFSGNGSAGVFSYNKPIDESLKMKNEEIAKTIKDKKKIRLIYGLVSFIAVPMIFFIILMMTIVSGGLGVTFVIELLIQVGLAVGFVFIHKDVKNWTEYQASYLVYLQNIRKNIVDISRDQSLSVEDTQRKIQELLIQVKM